MNPTTIWFIAFIVLTILSIAGLSAVSSYWFFNNSISHTLLFFLMAMTAMVSLSWNPFNVSESDQETASTTMTILMFAMLSIGLLFAMLPSNSSLSDYLFRNHSVLQTTGFTLGLLLFLLFMPANILNSYSYVFVPILLIAGLFAFFKSDSADDEKSKTINSIISLFCAMVSFGALMTSDPGGVMSRFVGGPVSLTLLFITLLFSLLYVLSLNITKPVESVGGLIGFALFICASLVFIAFNRQNLVLVFSMMIPFFLACIVGCSLLTTSSLVASIQTNDSYKLIFFGLYIFSMFIVLLWFVIMNAGQSIQYWIINGLILLLLFGTVASIVKGKSRQSNNNGNGNGRMSAIGWNTAQYIPCMMTDLMTAIKQQIAATNSGSLLMLLIALALFVVYFLSPSVFNLISNQGGILLLNDPVSLSNSTTLTRTQDQEDDANSPEPIYAFAISFWVCMDIVQAPNEFYSVLTTGGAPDVEYNPKTHVMRIVMNRGIEGGGIDVKGGTVLHIDEFPQQAWTHVVININGGLMDVFINGIIRATKTGIVPYYKQNGIVVGSSIHGGICNILYFDHALRSLNVSILYNTHKSSDPPVQSLTNKETTQYDATVIHTSTQLQ